MLPEAGGCLVAVDRDLDVFDADLQLARLVDALRAFVFPGLAGNPAGQLKVAGVAREIGPHVLVRPGPGPVLQRLGDFGFDQAGGLVGGLGFRRGGLGRFGSDGRFGFGRRFERGFGWLGRRGSDGWSRGSGRLGDRFGRLDRCGGDLGGFGFGARRAVGFVPGLDEVLMRSLIIGQLALRRGIRRIDLQRLVVGLTGPAWRRRRRDSRGRWRNSGGSVSPFPGRCALCRSAFAGRRARRGCYTVRGARGSLRSALVKTAMASFWRPISVRISPFMNRPCASRGRAAMSASALSSCLRHLALAHQALNFGNSLRGLLGGWTGLLRRLRRRTAQCLR